MTKAGLLSHSSEKLTNDIEEDNSLIDLVSQTPFEPIHSS